MTQEHNEQPERSQEQVPGADSENKDRGNAGPVGPGRPEGPGGPAGRGQHGFRGGRGHARHERPGRERPGSEHAPEEGRGGFGRRGDPTGREHAGRGEPAEHEHAGHEHAGRGHAGHGGRNFWREWRDGRHSHGEEIPFGQPLSPKEMEAWRDFFHQSFGNWPEEHWIFGGRRFSPWHQGMDTFNPFVATLLSKGGGLLPLYVLHLIAQQPRYGNEIMDLLAERTNGQWVSNPGAIYPLLTLLEGEGFIAGQWEDPEKRTVRIYTITAPGQAEVTRIKMIVSPKLEETVQVLQEFLADLHSQPAGAETDSPLSGESDSHSPAGTQSI